MLERLEVGDKPVAPLLLWALDRLAGGSLDPLCVGMLADYACHTEHCQQEEADPTMHFQRP